MILECLQCLSLQDRELIFLSNPKAGIDMAKTFAFVFLLQPASSLVCGTSYSLSQVSSALYFLYKDGGEIAQGREVSALSLTPSMQMREMSNACSKRWHFNY